jgi:hypothetical protein
MLEIPDDRVASVAGRVHRDPLPVVAHGVKEHRTGNDAAVVKALSQPERHPVDRGVGLIGRVDAVERLPENRARCS